MAPPKRALWFSALACLGLDVAFSWSFLLGGMIFSQLEAKALYLGN
jgi:hypothetical protein